MAPWGSCRVVTIGEVLYEEAWSDDWMIWGYPHLGKFDHDRTLFSRTLEIMVFIGKSSQNGRKIQVSELLQFTQPP